jgi:hypothetical protein
MAAMRLSDLKARKSAFARPESGLRTISSAVKIHRLGKVAAILRHHHALLFVPTFKLPLISINRAAPSPLTVSHVFVYLKIPPVATAACGNPSPNAKNEGR